MAGLLVVWATVVEIAARWWPYALAALVMLAAVALASGNDTVRSAINQERQPYRDED